MICISFARRRLCLGRNLGRWRNARREGRLKPENWMTASNLVHGSHAVHFYDDERPLYDAVIRYLGWGLETGEAAVVIATPAHRNEFERQLSMCALDVGAAKRRRQLILLDAQTTLDRFMDGPLVDSERCL